MSTVTVQHTHDARISTSRIWRAGALAALLSALANTVVRILAVTLQPVDPAFTALGWLPPAMLSVIGVLGATVVFWIVSRRARRPAAVFTAVAVVTLLLSLVPDLLLLDGGPLEMPGATAWAVGALMIMHVVTFAISVPLLTRTARDHDVRRP